MKKALWCQTPGRALPPPRAVPQTPRGMVGECRPQTVRRQPIRRWTASSRSRSRSRRNILLGASARQSRAQCCAREFCCKILLGCRLSNLLLVEAVKCVAAPSPVCPDSRAPSSVPRPAPRCTARGPLGPRRGQRRRPRRRRSPARTTAHGAAAHRPALTLPPYSDRVRRRPRLFP